MKALSSRDVMLEDPMGGGDGMQGRAGARIRPCRSILAVDDATELTGCDYRTIGRDHWCGGSS